MANLIDNEKYNYLYFSDKVSQCKYRQQIKVVDTAKLQTQIFLDLSQYYRDIVGGLYGRDFDKHIPKFMEKLLLVNGILHEYGLEHKIDSENSPQNVSYRKLAYRMKRYECENSHYYFKPVRIIGFPLIRNQLTVCLASKRKPKSLIHIAAEAYANSEQIIYTSDLDLIQYNFKDILFTIGSSDEKYTLFDILLMKFVFHYFLKRNDTIFPKFNLVCRCTYGLKNNNHLVGSFSKNIENLCILCNSLDTQSFKKFFRTKNLNVCYC